MKIITVIIFTLLSTQGFSGQKFYKWTDENGNTHYSATEPEDKNSAEVNVSTHQPVVNKKTKKSNPVAASDEKDYAQQRKKKRQEARMVAQENKQKCVAAKKTITKFEQQVRMSRIDKKSGEKIYLEDSQRDDILKKAKKAVRQYC